MHKKQNNKESKSYVQGLRPFGRVLPKGLRGILKKSGYNYSEIISKWSMLVGRDISNCSYPKSIKTTKESTNGILILAVKRGDEIIVEYSKKEIIDKINSYFGYRLINEIRLQTFNSDNKKIKKKDTLVRLSKNFEEKINEINNKDIKNSLFQLFNVMKND